MTMPAHADRERITRTAATYSARWAVVIWFLGAALVFGVPALIGYLR